MKFEYLTILFLIIVYETQSQQSSITIKTENNLNEFSMVDVLRKLNFDGDPSTNI